jgi:hypothetical protein
LPITAWVPPISRSLPDAFVNRQRLAGHQRLVDHQIDALQQHRVSRDLVAALDMDQVADHQFIIRDLAEMPIASHLDRDIVAVLLEQLESLVRLVFAPRPSRSGQSRPRPE